MSKSLKKGLIIGYILFSFLIFAVILIIPQTREWFKRVSTNLPFLMGFIKFSVLATCGELLSLYISHKQPTVPPKIVFRFIIWGLIGIWITFMMKVYQTTAVSFMKSGVLPGGDSGFLKALYTSVMMNTTFGPTFMAVHKCTDKILELWDKNEKISVANVVSQIDWTGFVKFTIIKTVPLFWIPAHTITFMLPKEYQVMVAALLSVALGIFLSFGKKTKETKNGI